MKERIDKENGVKYITLDDDDRRQAITPIAEAIAYEIGLSDDGGTAVADVDNIRYFAEFRYDIIDTSESGDGYYTPIETSIESIYITIDSIWAECEDMDDDYDSCVVETGEFDEREIEKMVESCVKR